MNCPVDGVQSTGLGLPLCSEIMEIHGGSIRVESVHGQGSVFYLDFPLCRIVSGPGCHNTVG
ncbi:MAG: hypothetical protein HZB29_06670 [Nitrospinae bacterium]|nr:hypothetical protein [Nitrospinota bacterium]